MASGVSCHYRESPPSISFSGSGFLATYQLGVAHCLLNCVPWILRTAPFVLGASAGSLVAAAVVCEISFVTIRDEMLHFAKQIKALTLGPFNPSINVFHWLERILRKYLPPDAHKMANGRLAVAVTRMTDGKPFTLSEFQSRDDVLQALLCSCYVPGYCGLVPPSFKGVNYVDGGFCSMQPVPAVPCNRVFMVSPFSGETDICPTDKPCMLDMVVNGTILKCNIANCFRIANALYPMTVESLEQEYDSGYKDALHFLQSNDLIPCLTYRICQVQLNCNQSKTCRVMEIYMEGEEEKKEMEMRVEKETTTLTSFADDGYMQTDDSAEHESSDGGPVKEPLLSFEPLDNVMLCNIVTYLTMFGLPARTLSHLLLPLTLLFYTAHQIRHRFSPAMVVGMTATYMILHFISSLLELFMQSSEMGFWVWYSLRHFTCFFYHIMVSSIKENMQNQIMPITVFLQWVKVQSQHEPPHPSFTKQKRKH